MMSEADLKRLAEINHRIEHGTAAEHAHWDGDDIAWLDARLREHMAKVAELQAQLDQVQE